MSTSREQSSHGSGPPALGHTLKRIGYWAPLPRWSMTYPAGQPPLPDVRRAVRTDWRSNEREQLVAYLRNGHRCNKAYGYSYCRFECRVTYSFLGSGELTDGEWVWPEGLPHYVERHGVTLPDEFAAAAAVRAWIPPPLEQVGALVPGVLLFNTLRIGDVEQVARAHDRFRQSESIEFDDSVWLAWSTHLPEVAAAQSSPDPRVSDHFSLILQYSNPDVPNELPDGFDEHVWRPVGERYGRLAPNFGDERVIEWIPVVHREAVVAQVLEGLRRHGLTSRVKVLCSVPAAGDWQRNHDVVVWPPEPVLV